MAEKSTYASRQIISAFLCKKGGIDVLGQVVVSAPDT